MDYSGLNDTQISAQLAALTKTVAAGNAAELQRKDVLRAAYAKDPAHWTQTRLAEEAGISQAAVSKIVNAPQVMNPSWHDDKPGYLLGRLLGVASWVEVRLYERQVRPDWEGTLDKLVAGTVPPVPELVQRVKSGMVRDLSALSEDQQEAARGALVDIEAAGAPLGSVRLSQQEQTWMLLGLDAQKHVLSQAL